MNLRIVASGWCMVLVAAAGAATAAPDGAALYEEHCAVCHDSRGRGGIGLPLPEAKLDQVSDEYLYRSIRLGRPGRIMPAFAELSDAQVRALVTHMRSWSGKPGMRFDPAPITGDVAAGQALYERHCAKCHGNDGSGEGAGTGVTLSRERKFMVMPAAINNAGFLNAAPDAMIKHVVGVGRPDSDMPGFAEKLSDTEINAVVAYVRTFANQAAAVAEEPSAQRPPALVVESPHDFETTLDNVHQALIGANFRLFPDRFLEEGLTDEFSHNTRQVSIRFCNFKQLYNMLNIEPRLGVVLPCTITVVEQADGRVLLVAPDMHAISHWFNNAELEQLGEQMEQSVVGILEEATL